MQALSRVCKKFLFHLRTLLNKGVAKDQAILLAESNKYWTLHNASVMYTHVQIRPIHNGSII